MTEEEEIKIWNEKAKVFLNNITNDKVTNQLMLAFEFSNVYRMGKIDGVKKYNEGHR
jgi:hypothetical protein